MLEARNVAVTYRARGETVQAVRSASLRCEAGTLTLLQGPSGSGKSSLFSVLGGLVLPTSGEMWVKGMRLDHMSDRQRTALRRKEMALIFQAYNLFPTLTAAENVAYALRGCSAQEVRRRVGEALEQVGMTHRMQVRPDRLSGGEQQRVAIARALAQAPDVLLADEPTGALDVANAENIMQILCRFAKAHGATILMISHDPNMTRFADQRLEIREGILSSVQAC